MHGNMFSVKPAVTIDLQASSICLPVTTIPRAIGRLRRLAVLGYKRASSMLVCLALASMITGCSKWQTDKHALASANRDVYLSESHGKKSLRSRKHGQRHSRSYRVKGKTQKKLPLSALARVTNPASAHEAGFVPGKSAQVSGQTATNKSVGLVEMREWLSQRQVERKQMGATATNTPEP